MSILFEPFKIGPIEIWNRFMRSATTSYWSYPTGVLRQEIIKLYERLAQGGVGLIVKGHLFVTESGKAHAGMAGISNEAHTPMLEKLTAKVHQHQGKILAQLNHAGIYSTKDRAGPSIYKAEDWVARPLSTEEIWKIIEAFGDAAERALDAGFDGVQIHGAHGYLISQFLSKSVNKRKDQWGGSLENRMLLLLEVYDEIRTRLGPQVPVSLKMNCDDFSPAGFFIEEAVKVAEKVSEEGVNLIEVSGGGVGRQGDLRMRARSSDPDLEEAEFAGYARKIREITKSTPLALVSGIRSKRCMVAIIEKDLADLVSMSRPFIRDPDLVKHLRKGQESTTCSTCNACRSRDVFGKMMLRCHGV